LWWRRKVSSGADGVNEEEERPRYPGVGNETLLVDKQRMKEETNEGGDG
jgi:hypothetical protein